MNWVPLEFSSDVTLDDTQRPLEELSNGNIPAIIVRGALDSPACREIANHLVNEGHLFDPAKPIPDSFLQDSIPEGYFRDGAQEKEWATAQEALSSHGNRLRIDIGTSLGYRGSDRNDFFQRSRESNGLLDRLFEHLNNPVDRLYSALQSLAVGKTVQTAMESDGSIYGKAIIRAHYGGYTYKPHFDSVRNREKRSDYAVHQFDHQFAGVLVLQNAVRNGCSAQCIIHRCFWKPEISPHLANNTFHLYAEQNNIPNVRIDLEPGDLYFFNTGCIHEVPGVDGEQGRIVVATFIGFSKVADDVFVWS